MPLEQYSQFLLTSYGLEYTDTTWRDIVTRLARLDEEVLGTLDWPLAAVSRESNKNGALVTLRLFGSHEKAVTAQKQVDELTKDINAIQRVSNGDYMPYRALKARRNERQPSRNSPTREKNLNSSGAATTWTSSKQRSRHARNANQHAQSFARSLLS
ncbi:hypothetical protein GCM10007338_06610 [Corynebacterium pelargi]|nr:hypothetical protein GCM10007338_06610 [Corynebacterium pelargi]